VDAEKAQPDTFNFVVGPIYFKIVPRSAYGIFEFLGTLLRMQRDRPPPTATAYIPSERLDEEKHLPMLRTVPPGDDPYILSVVFKRDANCFTATDAYCVPTQATTTKHVFGLLAALVGIQTASNFAGNH
jgi:hypothetical protein